MNNNDFFINTELNTDGVKKGAQDINQTMENVAKETEQTTQNVNENIEKTGGKFNEVADKIINKAVDIKEALQDSFSVDTTIDTTGAKDLEVAPVDDSTAKVESLKDRIVGLLDEISLKFYQSGTRNGELMGNTINQLAGTVENFGNTTKKVFDSTFGRAIRGAVSGVWNLGKSLTQLAATGVKAVGGTIANGFKKIGVAALNTAKNVLLCRKANNNMNAGFKRGFLTMLKYGLGIRSLFVLFNKLRHAAKEGLGNLAKEDSKTNASISGLVSALATLKNAFATAFSPILNIVAPILTGFINQLVDVANIIGAVLAKLTGASTFQKAIAVQKDYAKSLDKTSKSAKNQTLSIDELNQSVSDTDGSGGGSQDMFEETPIDAQAEGMAERFKKMWEEADFSDLGHTVGSKVADALDKISWNEIKNKTGKIGKSIATFINGFVEFPDLGHKIGNSLAQAFNTALEFCYQFVTNLHWGSVGQFIGDAINGALLNFDWKKLAVTISEGIKGWFTMLTNVFSTVNWQDIGRKLMEGIRSIDYAGIAETFFRLVGTALASAVEFVYGFVQDVVADIRDYFKQYIDEYIATSGDDSLGHAIIYGIFNGIIDAMVGVYNWIKEHIFEPFIEGFKDAFEIHSPSHVMYEMGQFIIQGLFDGIKGIWDKTKEVFEGFKTKVVDTMTGMKEKVIEVFTALKSGIKTPINAILGIIETFCNAIVRGINKVIESLNSLNIDVPDWVSQKFGITSFGFNIPTLAEVSLPKLATGTVIPRNSGEFAAILGDNNRETEVVSPLSTIQDAVSNVLEPYLAKLIDNTEELINKELNVNIGDREIAQANNRGQKKLGYKLAT